MKYIHTQVVDVPCAKVCLSTLGKPSLTSFDVICRFLTNLVICAFCLFCTFSRRSNSLLIKGLSRRTLFLPSYFINNVCILLMMLFFVKLPKRFNHLFYSSLFNAPQWNRSGRVINFLWNVGWILLKGYGNNLTYNMCTWFDLQNLHV